MSDQYNEELLALSAVFGNFKQLTGEQNILLYNKILGSDVDNLIKSQSLLYSAETEEFVEFQNGKPFVFVKYNAIIVIGISKHINDIIGICSEEKNNSINLSDYYFYDDYFTIHPLKSCSILDNIQNLRLIMHENINFCKMPMNSIINIEKIMTIIDQNDLNSLLKVQQFLKNDKKRIDLIQSMINSVDEKIRRFIESMQIGKKSNEQKIKTLLEIRGGSIGEYMKTIKEIDEKIIIFH